jgi:hypothetical protein
LNTWPLGTIELYRHNGTDRLSQARQQAEELGAMSTAAVLDLQLAAAADGRYDLDELARYARESLSISERLGLEEVRAKALVFLVESCALRGDGEGTEQYAAQVLAAAGSDRMDEAFVWSAGRAMLALLRDDQAVRRPRDPAAGATLRGTPRRRGPAVLGEPGRDRAGSRRAQAGGRGPGEQGDRDPAVPVAPDRREARREPAPQDRRPVKDPAGGPASGLGRSGRRAAKGRGVPGGYVVGAGGRLRILTDADGGPGRARFR